MTTETRLEKFWQWGHNCAVLDFDVEQVSKVLTYFGFDENTMTLEEHDTMMEGFHHRPLKRDGANLYSVDLGPMPERNNA